MGTWGTGIYSNDTAEDVRELCQEVFPFVSVEEGNRIVFLEFEETINSRLIDDDYASFWYALADWQWKHGILSDEIRLKAIELLSAHTGIEDWKESASLADVRKRLGVMEQLKNRLDTPMPEPKLPKGRLEKPKHKPGDVIVFKIFDGIDNTWNFDRFTTPIGYQSHYIRGSSEISPNPISVRGKYLAILCVGSERKLHSEYIPDLYDENSTYVIYDYCGEEKPSLEDLKKCGFLPMVNKFWHGDDRLDFVWAYKFTTSSSFRLKSTHGVVSFEKMKCKEESERFNDLLSQKPYSDCSVWCLDLFHMFAEFFCEKARLSNLNVEMDNLLDVNLYNPELLKNKSKGYLYGLED